MRDEDQALRSRPRPQPRPAAGRHLILIGITAALVLMLGLAAVLNLSLRRIDATERRQARIDAFRGAQFIRDRLLMSLEVAGPDADIEDSGGDWLQPLLEELVAEDSRLTYVMVVSPGGQVVAHSDTRLVGQQVPPEILDRIAPPVITGEWESEVDWAGLGRVLDMSLPVVSDGQELGTIHLGIQESTLTRQVVHAQSFVPVILTLTCLICLTILTATLLTSGLAVRRARVATQRLAQARHRAEVGALAAGLVHEIRNPLNAMRMQVALLRRRIAPPSNGTEGVTTTLDHLEGELARGQKMASDFLDFGRPPQGGTVGIDLRRILRETAEFLAPEFEQSGLALLLELPEDDGPMEVAIDQGRMRQVVLNLAANARAAMTPGGRLTISLERKSRRAVLRLSDTGVGIAAESLPHIFDVFYTTRPGGAGLGLTIVRQIVEDAGGDIRVASEAGRGATVEITLPLMRRRASTPVTRTS